MAPKRRKPIKPQDLASKILELAGNPQDALQIYHNLNIEERGNPVKVDQWEELIQRTYKSRIDEVYKRWQAAFKAHKEKILDILTLLANDGGGERREEEGGAEVHNGEGGRGEEEEVNPADDDGGDDHSDEVGRGEEGEEEIQEDEEVVEDDGEVEDGIGGNGRKIEIGEQNNNPEISVKYPFVQKIPDAMNILKMTHWPHEFFKHPINLYNRIIPITDLKSLRPTNWVHESIIDIFLMLTRDSALKEGLDILPFGSTFMLELLSTNGLSQESRIWLTSADIWRNDIWLMPIVTERNFIKHWSLMVVIMTDKYFLYLDPCQPEPPAGLVSRVCALMASIPIPSSSLRSDSFREHEWKLFCPSDFVLHRFDCDEVFECSMYLCVWAYITSTGSNIHVRPSQMENIRIAVAEILYNLKNTNFQQDRTSPPADFIHVVHLSSNNSKHVQFIEDSPTESGTIEYLSGLLNRLKHRRGNSNYIRGREGEKVEDDLVEDSEEDAEGDSDEDIEDDLEEDSEEDLDAAEVGDGRDGERDPEEDHSERARVEDERTGNAAMKEIEEQNNPHIEYESEAAAKYPYFHEIPHSINIFENFGCADFEIRKPIYLYDRIIPREALESLRPGCSLDESIIDGMLRISRDMAIKEDLDVLPFPSAFMQNLLRREGLSEENKMWLTSTNIWKHDLWMMPILTKDRLVNHWSLLIVIPRLHKFVYLDPLHEELPAGLESRLCGLMDSIPIPSSRWKINYFKADEWIFSRPAEVFRRNKAPIQIQDSGIMVCVWAHITCTALMVEYDFVLPVFRRKAILEILHRVNHFSVNFEPERPPPPADFIYMVRSSSDASKNVNFRVEPPPTISFTTDLAHLRTDLTARKLKWDRVGTNDRDKMQLGRQIIDIFYKGNKCPKNLPDIIGHGSYVIHLEKTDWGSLATNAMIAPKIIDSFFRLLAVYARKINRMRVLVFPHILVSSLLDVNNSLNYSLWAKYAEVWQQDLWMLPLQNKGHWGVIFVILKSKTLIYVDNSRKNPERILLKLLPGIEWFVRLVAEKTASELTEWYESSWKIYCPTDTSPRNSLSCKIRGKNCGTHIMAWAYVMCTGIAHTFKDEDLDTVRRGVVNALSRHFLPPFKTDLTDTLKEEQGMTCVSPGKFLFYSVDTSFPNGAKSTMAYLTSLHQSIRDAQ